MSIEVIPRFSCAIVSFIAYCKVYSKTIELVEKSGDQVIVIVGDSGTGLGLALAILTGIVTTLTENTNAKMNVSADAVCFM